MSKKKKKSKILGRKIHDSLLDIGVGKDFINMGHKVWILYQSGSWQETERTLKSGDFVEDFKKRFFIKVWAGFKESSRMPTPWGR